MIQNEKVIIPSRTERRFLLWCHDWTGSCGLSLRNASSCCKNLTTNLRYHLWTKNLQLVICSISNNLDVQYGTEFRVSQFNSPRKHQHSKRIALGISSLKLGLNKFENRVSIQNFMEQKYTNKNGRLLVNCMKKYFIGWTATYVALQWLHQGKCNFSVKGWGNQDTELRIYDTVIRDFSLCDLAEIFHIHPPISAPTWE